MTEKFHDDPFIGNKANKIKRILVQKRFNANLREVNKPLFIGERWC